MSRRNGTAIEVYERDVDRDCEIIPETDPTLGNCWGWRGVSWKTTGYSRVNAENRSHQAHRVGYEHFVGPIPDGYDLDHLCMNKWCVRPTHLDPVSHAENIRRWAEQTITHCPRGHPYTAENLVKGGPHRRCLTCNQDYSVNRNTVYRQRKSRPMSDKTRLGWILRNSGRPLYQWCGLFQISPTTMTKYITGAKVISHADMLVICNVLDVDPEDILGSPFPQEQSQPLTG